MRHRSPRVAARPVRSLLALLALVVLTAGCDRGGAPPPEDPRRPVIQVASFDFSESELLAEVYGQALGQHGYPVEQVVQLGSREVVPPPSSRARSTWSPSTWARSSTSSTTATGWPPPTRP